MSRPVALGSEPQGLRRHEPACIQVPCLGLHALEPSGLPLVPTRDFVQLGAPILAHIDNPSGRGQAATQLQEESTQ